MNAPLQENIAQTLARELPYGKVLLEEAVEASPYLSTIRHVLVPHTFDLKVIDDEPHLPGPRRTKAAATFLDADSFLNYTATHSGAGAAVWCDFNPVTYALAFRAVFDDHLPDAPGWRSHTATFKPRPSVEWDIWTGKNKAEQTQAAFAEFLEANEKDIAAAPGYPTSLDMMKMATAFEANSEKRFKSKVRLQSGGVALEYVNTDDDATIEQMKLFEKFQIGLPVFWELRDAGAAIKAWPIVARLKYRTSQGAVTFWYDLIRPDLVHELAAIDMIDRIRQGLGDVPLRMGACT